MLFESILNFVSFSFLSRKYKYNTFYIQLLYNARYIVNNVMLDIDELVRITNVESGNTSVVNGKILKFD